MTVELGLDTFGDITSHADGTLKRADEVLRDVVEEAVVADQAGCRFHRPWRTSPARFRNLIPRNRAGRHCRPHQPHPPWHRRHRAVDR